MGTPLLVFVTGLAPQGTLCHLGAQDARGEREGWGAGSGDAAEAAWAQEEGPSDRIFFLPG